MWVCVSIGLTCLEPTDPARQRIALWSMKEWWKEQAKKSNSWLDISPSNEIASFVCAFRYHFEWSNFHFDKNTRTNRRLAILFCLDNTLFCSVSHSGNRRIMLWIVITAHKFALIYVRICKRLDPHFYHFRLISGFMIGKLRAPLWAQNGDFLIFSTIECDIMNVRRTYQISSFLLQMCAKRQIKSFAVHVMHAILCQRKSVWAYWRLLSMNFQSGAIWCSRSAQVSKQIRKLRLKSILFLAYHKLPCIEWVHVSIII